MNYPQRAVGFFLHTFNGSSFFFCTASLISNSILLTAGHCVYNPTSKKFITAGTFYPACVDCNSGGAPTEPYGHADANTVFTTSGWANAKNEDTALNKSIDVALVTLNTPVNNPNNVDEMGTATGYLGYCSSNCGNKYWHLSQVGYPGNYDGGNRMNVSEHLEKGGKTDFTYGTGMEGGSSGGPHISNIGSVNDSSSNLGQFTNRNVVFAVTSWGYNDDAVKIQGSSPLSGAKNGNNFPTMFNAACAKARTLHGVGSC